jgi:hypothetical protein
MPVVYYQWLRHCHQGYSPQGSGKNPVYVDETRPICRGPPALQNFQIGHPHTLIPIMRRLSWPRQNKFYRGGRGRIAGNGDVAKKSALTVAVWAIIKCLFMPPRFHL